MADQQKYTNKLYGKRVLILGGSSGIGYGVAEASLEYGAIVYVSSSNSERIQKAVTKLQEAYPSKKDNVHGEACDLGSDDVEANIVKLLKSVGPVDHVVFTATDSLAIMNLKDVDITKIKAAGQMRFYAPILLAKHLANSSTSSLTLTTGSSSFKPVPNWSVIVGYASALHALTRNLALDLAPIRVNLISPGPVETELWAGMPDSQRQAMFKSIEAKLPTGKVGRVEDVAEAYLSVMRDGNCTGAIVQTDGGSLLV